MRLAVIATLLFLCSTLAFAAEDPRILDIRSEYQAIKASLSQLQQTEIYLDGYSAEGGSATYYSDRTGALRFVQIALYGESGKSFEEHYYRGGQVIFVFTRNHHYNVPFYISEEIAREIGGPAFDPEKTRILEDHYYFHDQTLIRWINENEVSVDISSAQALATGEEILSFAREIESRRARAEQLD